MPAQPDIDLRHLPAPEPMLRALEVADALAPGEVVAVIAPMLPRPLLMELAQLGYAVQAEAAQVDGSVRVVISRPDDAQASA